VGSVSARGAPPPPPPPPPGAPQVYRVKLLVDNEWRLCQEWPTEDDGKGNTVNVLTVEPLSVSQVELAPPAE